MRCVVACNALLLSSMFMCETVFAACAAFVKTYRDCNKDIRKRQLFLRGNSTPLQSLATRRPDKRAAHGRSKSTICVVRRGHVMSLSDSVQLSETMHDTKFDTPTQEPLLHDAGTLRGECYAHIGGAAAVSLLIALSYWQWMT